MPVLEKMAGTQALLFLYILAGALIRKTGIITPATRGSYNLFLLNVTLPAMILHSFLQGITPQQMREAWAILLVSGAGCLGAYLLGRLLWRRKEPGRRSILLFGTMFSNAGNAGMPVAQLVFGDAGVFYASLFLIPTRVLMWTLGISLFIGDRGKGKLRALLLNPSVLVVFLGFGMMLLNVRPPALLAAALKNIGDITGPLAMILIGTTLAELDLKEAMHPDAFLLAGVRLLLIPALVLGVLRLAGCPPLVTSVAVTLYAMPVATNTVVLAERYGADYRFGSRCVFVSTVLSLFTVPLVTAFF